MELLQKASMIDVKSYLLDQDLHSTIKVMQEHANICDLKDTDISCVCHASSTKINGNPVLLGKDLIHDIEMFSPYNLTSSAATASTVLSAINHTHTKGGSEFLKRIMSTPITQPDILKERSCAVRSIKDHKNKNIIKQHLSSLKENEHHMAWVFDTSNEELQQLYEIAYFSSMLTRHLNTNSKALTAYNIYRIIISPTIGILTPISYIIIPFLVVRYRLGMKMPFLEFLKFTLSTMLSGNATSMFLPKSLSSLGFLPMLFTIFFYFQGIFNSVELAKAVNRVSKTITTHINGFINFIKAAHQLSIECPPSQVLSPFLSNLPTPSNSLDTFKDYTPKPYSIFKNFGKQLAIFKRIKKDDYLPLINIAYAIDSMASIATCQSINKFTPAVFVDAPDNKPYISMRGGVHPCIPLNKAISNNITLGDVSFPANALITGPNAGGKSTIIKTLLINTLLAQTITLTPSQQTTLTPFHLIKSQINIPDCKGKESLFEAEMYRSKENLDTLKELEPHQTALIVMDEIFNSTNPVEGIAGAYAIAKKMASHSNAACIITTHYIYLTKLAKELPQLFRNYKMNVIIDPLTEEIKYPYKLKQGVSRQYIALELLKKNGFDDELIKDALAIKARITSSAPVEKQKEESQPVEPEEENANTEQEDISS